MDSPAFDGWTCPLPLKNYPTIVMGHGAGGKMMNDLIRHMFASQFDNDLLSQLEDSTSFDLDVSEGQRLAFTTDSFVVSPLIFLVFIELVLVVIGYGQPRGFFPET